MVRKGKIVTKRYDYVASKVKNLERHVSQLPPIVPEKIEIPDKVPSNVAADASRNSYQLEAATIFEVRAVAYGTHGIYIVEHIDVVPVPHAQEIFTRLIMEALEHRTLARYIVDNNPDLVLLDGSLMTPTGIILQYPDRSRDFKKEYIAQKELYGRYFEIFEKVLDETFDNMEEHTPIALFNLQHLDLDDEYNDLKQLHEKIVKTLSFSEIFPEVHNFIQALAYYEYMYETNRLYKEVFKKKHVAITKTNIASYITDTYLDKYVARRLFKKYGTYPGMIRFYPKNDLESKPAVPEYFEPMKRFPEVMSVYYEPPSSAYYIINAPGNVYIAETYNDISEILGYVARLSPPGPYYPRPLEKAHYASQIKMDEMRKDVTIVKNIALSEALEYHVRRALK